MTEQEYIDACDLRTWRAVKSIMDWLMPSDVAKQIHTLIYEEIDRLEPLVEKAMENCMRADNG